MARARTSDLVLLALNQFIWGTGWSAIKYPQDQMGPVALNLWSLGISVITLLPLMRHESGQSRSLESKVLTKQDYLHYLTMGVVGVTGMTLLYAWGARISLAANGALISMAVPILTSLIAVLVLSEKITLGRVISLAIAVVGVVIISDFRWGELGFVGGYLLGNAVLLAGATCNAIYIVYSKKLLSSTSPLKLLFWAQLLGFLGSLPFLFFEEFHLQTIVNYRWNTWLALLFLGSIYFTLTMIIFYRILVRLDAGQITVSNYLQPFFGVLMAALLLGERISHTMILGGLLVIGGTALATFEESWRA
ncbi:MAG: DMT family transporter [Acidobacteria bacterium]|nr:DMT family transporter [Acidobacteriota bacterium]MCI0718775.1 DMT family transporter [Acidobacteriota bacterium]